MRRPVRLYRSPEITTSATVTHKLATRAVVPTGERSKRKTAAGIHYTATQCTQTVPTKPRGRRWARKIEILVPAVRDGHVAASTLAHQTSRTKFPPYILYYASTDVHAVVVIIIMTIVILFGYIIY